MNTIIPILLLACTPAVPDDTSTSGTSGGTSGTSGGTSGVTSGGTSLTTCEQVIASFQAEAESAMTCSRDDECGQVLPGTSCGCTQNWIARLDADTTVFYALLEQAATLECELYMTSNCDCPAVYGYVCAESTCGWDTVSPYPACRAGDGDAYDLVEASVHEDTLRAALSVSGGCAVHETSLCWPDPWFDEGEPWTTRIDLLHDGNDDPCDSIYTEEVEFDLTPLKEAWQANAQQTSGTVRLSLGTFELDYTF